MTHSTRAHQSARTDGGDDPLIGAVLRDRYEVLAPLGVGGMGRLYRALQRPLGRPVALKVLLPDLEGTRDRTFEARFFLEASMTARLRHANTVTIYDYGRSEAGVYFMALELVDGETLGERLRRVGSLHWAQALRIGAQVAGSLREAHGLGLVHRDLKPNNIMLVQEGVLGDRVKVVDFGLVKRLPWSEAVDQPWPVHLTEVGEVLGSPVYMAPEQARQATDTRSDYYSLGAVLFAAIAGRPPFLAKRPTDLLVKHLCDPPPELGTLAPGVPEAVSSLVHRCLEKDPERRFQSADELLRAIRGALARGPSAPDATVAVKTGRGPVPAAPRPPRPAASSSPSRSPRPTDQGPRRWSDVWSGSWA